MQLPVQMNGVVVKFPVFMFQNSTHWRMITYWVCPWMTHSVPAYLAFACSCGVVGNFSVFMFQNSTNWRMITVDYYVDYGSQWPTESGLQRKTETVIAPLNSYQFVSDVLLTLEGWIEGDRKVKIIAVWFRRICMKCKPNFTNFCIKNELCTCVTRGHDSTDWFMGSKFHSNAKIL
jgi:hypothetical protein